jgi:hypothetical protein
MAIKEPFDGAGGEAGQGEEAGLRRHFPAAKVQFPSVDDVEEDPVIGNFRAIGVDIEAGPVGRDDGALECGAGWKLRDGVVASLGVIGEKRFDVGRGVGGDVGLELVAGHGGGGLEDGEFLIIVTGEGAVGDVEHGRGDERLIGGVVADAIGLGWHGKTLQKRPDGRW